MTNHRITMWLVILIPWFLIEPLTAKQMPEENTIILSDKRILSFETYGDPNGFPVFYFHGGQESRFSSGFMDSTAQQLGIRIIAPERPGIGNSSFQPNREFLDWPNDVSELADHLNIEKFSLFGLSGGSPHVLACLNSIPERIEKASIVSGATPDNYKKSRKGMWLPVRLIHWFAGMKSDKQLRKFIESDYQSILKKPNKRIKQLQKYLPKPDKELLKSNPNYGWEFINGSVESYKQGIEGVVQEWKLYVKDWGFDLKEIIKPVTLWYGSSDKMTPKYKGYYLNNSLPNSELHLIENEGHFSLIRNHLNNILKNLHPAYSN